MPRRSGPAQLRQLSIRALAPARAADRPLRCDRPAQQNAPHIEKRGRGRPFDVRRVRRARRDEFSRLIQCA
ncbi:hypothetical protein CEQ30_33045 [Nocardia brasiliensis]|nr:hypothetical protein CEQ30_33045 [Nocardia brasiliensis]